MDELVEKTPLWKRCGVEKIRSQDILLLFSTEIAIIYPVNFISIQHMRANVYIHANMNTTEM